MTLMGENAINLVYKVLVGFDISAMSIKQHCYAKNQAKSYTKLHRGGLGQLVVSEVASWLHRTSVYALNGRSKVLGHSKC